MCGGFALLDHSLLVKVSPKDTPINFSSKDRCLKRSYVGGDCLIKVTGILA